MAANEKRPVPGIDHLTVVPTNFDPEDATDDGQDEDTDPDA